MADENQPHEERGSAMIVDALKETTVLAKVKLTALGIHVPEEQ